jgi:MoxR-like ATPase
VLVRDDLYDYAVRLVQASRITKDSCLPYAKRWVSWGAGPRACQNLVLGATAHAFFAGRTHITTDDIRAVALPVLRHRIIVNYAAVAEGIRSDDVVRELVKSVPAPADKAVA